MRIFIDPGHGHGTGATAQTPLGNRLVEDTLNFQVSSHLETLLEGYGHEVMVSRSEESNPSKPYRAILAAKYGSDLVICVHHNTALTLADSIKYGKSELYYRDGAQIVPERKDSYFGGPAGPLYFFETTPTPTRGKEWMRRSRNVMDPYWRRGLSNTVLFECMYLDNPTHQKILNQPAYPKSMAYAIANWVSPQERKSTGEV